MTDTTSTATNNNPDNDNTIDTTSDSTNMNATPTCTPFKIRWNSSIPANDSIHDSSTLHPADTSKTSQHPFIAKLSPSFISTASESHNSPIVIKTSKSKCVLQPNDLHPFWYVNDFKNHFSYSTSNCHVQFTLWISMPPLLTLWTLKKPILGHLRDADIYILRNRRMRL